MPPIDPDSMPYAEPPPMPETLDGFKSTSFVSGHMIDEYRNGWAVMQQSRNGTVLSEKRFFKSRGHDRQDALNYAQQRQREIKNGGS